MELVNLEVYDPPHLLLVIPLTSNLCEFEQILSSVGLDFFKCKELDSIMSLPVPKS